MDNPEYERYLLDIADDVEGLVAAQENRKRFEHHSCNLGEKHALYLKAFKRVVKQMPPDPLSTFQSVLIYENDDLLIPPPPKINEALAYYYFSLATIHDKMREGYIPIHNDTCAKQLAKSVWPHIENLCVDKQFIINAAFKYVKADLTDKTPAETEQTNAKSTFLAVLVSFLGILAFILWVHLLPITCLKDHPKGTGLQCGIILLTPCLVVGYFKPKYRKWCWGSAILPIVVLILSLL